MQKNQLKKLRLFYIVALLPLGANAEGIVDIKPQLSTSINYDDNVFRFSSKEQAKTILGSTATSDVSKQINLGVTINLTLSRQLITLSSNVNTTTYNRFSRLNNTGNANSLRWSWHLGDDFYGEVGVNETKAIAGFNESRNQVKNTTTTTRKFANINWNIIPDLTLKASREHVDYENGLISSNFLDRNDEIYQAGVSYQTPLNTEFGLSYRVTDSTFPNRNSLAKIVLGGDISQKELIGNVVWQPTIKTRLNAEVSEVTLDRNGTSVKSFSGFSQHWNLDHKLTDKLNLNITAYHDVTPVNEIASTYVKTKGFSFNPSWSVTSKVLLRAGLGYEERGYLGGTNITINNLDRSDKSTQGNLALIYTPTLKSLVQLEYLGENRTSNQADSGYHFNNINLSLRYDF